MSGAFAGRRALVLGWRVSGRAAADVLLKEGASVRVSEALPPNRLETAVTPAGVELLAGGHRPEHLDGVDLIVVSPGVPEGAPILSWAEGRGIQVWSELELGARLCRIPVVAVTGTNGKTTTTELIAAMMRSAGLDARACGNVGLPFSQAAREPLDALAVEASSFQLRFHQSLHPQVSVLLNLAPDHLDWHGSMDGYAAAKARILVNQGPGDVHVGNRDDPAAAAVSSTAPCDVQWFGWGEPEGEGVGVKEGRSHDGRLVALTDAGRVELPLPLGLPRPFRLDAAAATAAALAFGLPSEAIVRALGKLRPLPHRGAVVAEVGNVRFINDSKATNPHATLAALEGRTDTVLVAGGLAKGVDLSPLRLGAPALTAVVAIGQAAPGVAAAFRGVVPVRWAGSIEEAVAAAYDEAVPGGTVLLAPACASQDMFADYRERGERFTAAARALADQRPNERAGRERRADA